MSDAQDRPSVLGVAAAVLASGTACAQHPDDVYAYLGDGGDDLSIDQWITGEQVGAASARFESGVADIEACLVDGEEVEVAGREVDGVRRYDIALDDGGTNTVVYARHGGVGASGHDVQRAPDDWTDRRRPMDLRGRVGIVTAGAAGLGRHLASALAARRVHVVIGDVDGDAARSAAAEIERQGGVANSLATDVTHDEQLSSLVRFVTSLGPLGALVNNAGGWSEGGEQYPQAPASVWSGALDLNLRAPMLATQLCLGPMVANGGGAVVNIASSAAVGPDEYGSPEYAATKAALIRFTSSVRGLAATSGVRVSCVVPHWVGLARAQAEYDELTPEERARSGGLVDPAIVAGEVIALLEDDSSAGRIVGVRAGMAPYRLVPAGIDPEWR